MCWDSSLNILLFIQFIFICFMMIFDDPFLRMVYIFYLIYIFVHFTVLISIIFILLYYHTQYFIVNLKSFFDHQIIVFSRVLLYTIHFFFRVRSVCLSKNIYAKYTRIHLQSFVLILWFIHWISLFDHQIFSSLFLIYSLNLTFRFLEYKETIIHIFIHFYMVIQW